MRLSEAIRLGAMLKPQAFGIYDDGVGTCALGAAAMAMGRFYPDIVFSQEFQVLIDRKRCHECGYVAHTGGATVAHLNDHHRWTRERIADWIEGLEAAQEPQAPPVEDSACCVLSNAATTDGNAHDALRLRPQTTPVEV